MTTKSRGYAFTQFDVDNKPDPHKLKCQYLIYQVERSPKSGNLHLQGFVYFRNPRSFNAVRKALSGAHIEPARHDQKAMNYCKKTESRVSKPVEWGTPPKKKGRPYGTSDPKTKIKSFRSVCHDYDFGGPNSIHSIIERQSKHMEDPYIVMLTDLMRFCHGVSQDGLGAAQAYHALEHPSRNFLSQ